MTKILLIHHNNLSNYAGLEIITIELLHVCQRSLFVDYSPGLKSLSLYQTPIPTEEVSKGRIHVHGLFLTLYNV